MNRLFKGQVAIISGGIGDIGFATAIALARQGADIALGDVLPSDSQIVSSRLNMIGDLGVKRTYCQVDVGDGDAVKIWARGVADTLGTAQIVVANAAIATLASMYELTPVQWKEEINTNLNGGFYLAQAATALMLDRDLPGRVVFVGSWAASHVHLHMPAYSVSKAGLSMLCKCMALELAPKGISVNEIAPGYVDAGLSGRFWREKPELRDKARERVPMRQVITAEEVADQIVFLCHPDNKHMTGTTLLMDGGLSLK